VDKDNTTIVDGAGELDQIKARINQLKNEIENTDSDFDGRSCRRGWRSWPVA